VNLIARGGVILSEKTEKEKKEEKKKKTTLHGDPLAKVEW
jgi:hypothetical protein